MYKKLLIVAGILASATVAAQDTGFADDFTFDSTEFSAGTFDNSSGTWSITPSSEGMVLETRTNDESLPGSLFIETARGADSIGIDVSHGATGSYSGIATVFLETRLYSDTPDPDDRDGDIGMQMTYNRDEQGGYSVFYCLLRQVNGAEEPLGDFGGEFCDQLTAGSDENEVQRSLDIAMDRAANTVTISFDEISRTLTLPGTTYPPAYGRQRIQLRMDSGSLGIAAATLHNLRTDDRSIDLAANPISVDRYFPLYDVEDFQRTVSHSPGTLTLTARATTENDWRNRLFLQQPTDYLESTFTISGDSDFGDSGELRAQIELSLYNDQADGGLDGRTGDVDTYMEVKLGADGRAVVEYCLRRMESSDAGQTAGLLSDGRRCALLPKRPVLGEPLRLSIDFDKEAGTVSYRADEYVSVIPMEGPFFAHSDPFGIVAAGPRDLSTVVLKIDEIRSSRSALTTAEVNAGQSEPTAFPAVVTESVPVDSALSYPYTATMPLDFIDNFSANTQKLVFDPSGDERGDYGVAFINNALTLEAATTDPENCCAEARLRIQEDTDFVLARVSLSSETSLPVEDDARALIRIVGNWYNDTQDGGFDDRGGEVYVQLRLRQRGDGRREASFCFTRRNGDGTSEELNVVNGESCGSFERIPDLDTQYDLSIELDRDAATMTLGFADETRVIELGGPVFNAQRAEKSIEVQHEGESGRAVGHIHSLTTESETIDFESNPPVIAPYRPVYAASSAGRSVDVVDGRLRLEVDSAIGGDSNQPRFVSRSPSEFVQAVLDISSESRTDGGLIRLGVGGHMYNDLMNGGLGSDNSEGAVYASVNMVMNDEGEDYAEYCAYRSNTSNFSDVTELVGGLTDGCPKFVTQPSLDIPVKASISLDAAAGVLLFSFGEELISYTITTGIYSPNSYFNGIRADARGGSKLVAYADDLAFAADPVPLAESRASLTFVNGTALAPNTGSSSGGGCVISSESNGLAAPMLALLACIVFFRRTRSHELTENERKD